MSAPQAASGEAAPSVQRCTRADRPEQVRLFHACFKKPIDAAGLAWRYDDNPCGESLTFLARAADGSGVSGYACNARIAAARGEHAAAVGETGDVMTHPDWRKRGIFSGLDRAALAAAREQGWPLVFGLPNRRSAHIFLELGWQRVGTLRAWTCVLRPDAAARAERAKEGRLAGWTTGFAHRKARRALARARELGREHAPAPIEQRFPPEAGALAREVERRFAWMIRRDPAYLDWRYLRAPSGLFRALAVRDARGAFAGYAVVQLPRPGAGVGYLVDVLARDDAALSAAIAAGLDLLERSGAAVAQATAVDGSWWSAKLAQHGFVPPRPSSFLTIILHVLEPGHPLAAAARDPRAWYFTDGDRDDETMG